MHTGSKSFNKSIESDHFRYQIFPVWDAIGAQWARNHSMAVMDMSPLYGRPDAHPADIDKHARDCLHYCLPGPVDVDGNILMQMLFNNEIVSLS